MDAAVLLRGRAARGRAMHILWFLCAVAALGAGYLLYGRYMERLFGPDPARATPVRTMADGVDYIRLPPLKMFFIQLLNIAGLGPVFGAVMGALYGPAALLWIVVGSIFAGAVHDYFAGMISLRYQGRSITEVIGCHLGAGCRRFLTLFSIVLMVLVVVVFVTGPAALLVSMTGIDRWFWVIVILAYYFLATILPIDRIIGRIYPYFAAVLLFMTVGLFVAILGSGMELYPAARFANQHPDGLSLWPLMFVTIACGAVSGFHCTQGPMMARCMEKETSGRPVFYGAMIAEGLIALIWATLAMSFYPSPEALGTALKAGAAGKVVNDISYALLGSFGGALAIVGVVILPVSTGDTAMRAARLIIADLFRLPQGTLSSRLCVAVPLLALCAALTQIRFDTLWLYFSWANQVLAVFMLWTIAVYLVRTGKPHWFASLPAMFMTTVCVTYICYVRFGLGLPLPWATAVGVGAALGALALLQTRRERILALGEPGAESGRV